MKKNKLVKVFSVLIFVISIMVIFPKITQAGEENLLKYSQDLTNSVWTKYGAPDITLHGDGSQTIAQTTSAAAYMRQLLNSSNECLVDLENYILRIQLNTTGIADEYIRARLTNVGNGIGGYKTVTTLSYPEGLINWIPLTMPFIANTTGVGPYTSSMQVEGVANVSTALVKNMQITMDPGYTLYSTGDSICDYSINGTHVDGSANYTGFYEFAENIVANNVGVAGDLLSEIYTRMQTDLAGTTYPTIFIEGGINDINFAGSDPVSNMISIMTDMIILAKIKADKVVVFNISPNTGISADQISWQLNYNSQLETLCANQNVQYFDMLAILGNGTSVDRNMIYYDNSPAVQVHPNALGHETIATALTNQVTLPNSALYLSDYVATEGSCIADTTPPVRSDGSPSGTLASGTTQTTISLTTNEGAICKYDTTSGTAYDSMASTFATTSETSHSQLITGLSDGNTYNYYVKCKDRATNQNPDDYTINFSIDSNNPPTDITLSSNTIDENQSINTTVGTLTTTDSDIGDTHTYSLGCSTPGADDSSFNISSDSLRSSELFDYETKSSYAICIRTNDGTDTYDENFTITVNDVSEVTTCTSFTYSDWGTCQSNNKKTRTVTSSSPSGCTGGSPITLASCIYDDGNDDNNENPSVTEIIESITTPYTNIAGLLKEKLNTKKTIHVKKKKFSLKGKDTLLAGGKVKLYRGTKLKDKDTVDSDGKWKLKIKEKKNKTYTYKIKYYNENGDKIETKKYKIKIDTEDPVFTEIPNESIIVSRGETIHWKAQDNQKIKRFKVYFNGKIHKIQPPKHNKKEEVASSFKIPIDTPSGAYTMKIKAYDKARNKEIVYVGVEVR